MTTFTPSPRFTSATITTVLDEESRCVDRNSVLAQWRRSLLAEVHAIEILLGYPVESRTATIRKAWRDYSRDINV